MEEGFTFQCTGCWKVECLTAELTTLNGIVKGVEMRITKETDGRGRKEQCSDKKDEDRRLRRGASASASARKTNGQRTTKNMACWKVTRKSDSRGGGDSGKREERISCDRRKDEGKKGSESRCVEREVNNRDDDR
ncbi:hypothetical protein NP493_1728g00028 [Ridgeia piscesae]|uniref:Uncharacterized protein n=1 Tax=Ridgeia piscesae TaxID=27915 RepID=A0AAD9N8H6_RIDPI|nr:hypothetical protein NP493_1728g00028 [Ridgeia piscesae]